jgi:hypothetical protein
VCKPRDRFAQTKQQDNQQPRGKSHTSIKFSNCTTSE